MPEPVQIILATGIVTVAASLGTTWLASWLQERHDRKARVRAMRLKALDEAEEAAKTVLDLMISRKGMGTATPEDLRERARSARRGLMLDDSGVEDRATVDAFVEAMLRAADKPYDTDPRELMTTDVREAWRALQASIRHQRERIEQDKG